MTRPRQHSTLPDLAHRAAKARDVLLMTILSRPPETMDASDAVHAYLDVYALAKRIQRTGEAPPVATGGKDGGQK